MKVLIVTSTPNSDGLTAACGEAARQGVVDGHSPARVINLNDYTIGSCTVCEDDGWGPCKTEHRCSLEDDFGELQKIFGQAEGYVWISPVYFGEPSEPMKAFFDRLRRCEMTRAKGETILSGKPTVCVAAAGGSGGGAVSCLAVMERWVEQLKADPFDYIPITQRTREYQLETIHDALTTMCTAAKTERVQEMPLSARRRPSRRRFRRPQKEKKG